MISLGPAIALVKSVSSGSASNNRAQVQRIPVDRLAAIALFLLKTVILGERPRVAKVQRIPVNAPMAVGLLLKSVFSVSHLSQSEHIPVRAHVAVGFLLNLRFHGVT